MSDHTHDSSRVIRMPWNKGKLTGQKPPLKRTEIWAIRVHLQLAQRVRDLALFNLAIDSKLRGCDLVRLRVRDVALSEQILSRTMVVQQKTGRPCSLKSPNRHERPYRPGSPKPSSQDRIIYSPAVTAAKHTSQHDNMPVW